MSWARQIHLKSPAELETMREAGRINASVLATVKALLKPGVSTADLNAAAEEVLRKHACVSPFKGYGHPPFPASITVSINQELVHGIPSRSRRLKAGDIVSVDCGTVLDGLVADSAFTAGVGELSPEAHKLLDVTKGALEAAIEKMRVGHRTGDVSVAIQQHVESQGFHVTREYTGSGMPLKAGMTIAIEPMVLVGTEETRVLPDQWTVVSADGSLTAHFEHTIAVTEGAPLILTVQ